jgi:hypothetical protein
VPLSVHEKAASSRSTHFAIFPRKQSLRRELFGGCVAALVSLLFFFSVGSLVMLATAHALSSLGSNLLTQITPIAVLLLLILVSLRLGLRVKRVVLSRDS